MRLLCITDLHGSATALARILAHAGRADLVLLGGDITNFQTPERAERLVRQVLQAGMPVLAVAGNCDSPAIDQRLVELGVSIHGRGTVIGQYGFYGVSAMPPWTGTMYELTEPQIDAALAAGRRAILPHSVTAEIVVSHAPPRGLVDGTRSGQRVGSTALRDFLETHAPALVICGHIHEARGIEEFRPEPPAGPSSPGAPREIGAARTTVVNCGLASSGYYALVEVGDAVAGQLRRA